MIPYLHLRQHILLMPIVSLSIQKSHFLDFHLEINSLDNEQDLICNFLKQTG
jgi:hypothetical protein